MIIGHVHVREKKPSAVRTLFWIVEHFLQSGNSWESPAGRRLHSGEGTIWMASIRGEKGSEICPQASRLWLKFPELIATSISIGAISTPPVSGLSATRGYEWKPGIGLQFPDLIALDAGGGGLRESPSTRHRSHSLWMMMEPPSSTAWRFSSSTAPSWMS